MARNQHQPDILRALRTRKGPERAQSLYEVVQRSYESNRERLWRWQRGRAFARGDQWGRTRRGSGTTTWDNDSPATAEVKASRVTFNHIQKIKQHKRAMFTQDRPSFDASAGTSEGLDRARSKAASQLLRHNQRQHALDNLYGSIADDAFDTGTGVLQVRWNEHLGRQIEEEEPDYANAKDAVFKLEKDPSTGAEFEVMVSDFEIPTKVTKRMTGELEYRLLPIEAIGVPTRTRGDADCAWICVREEMSLFEVVDRWGQAKADDLEVGPPKGEDISPWEVRDEEGSVDEVVEVFWLYMRQCRGFPRGREVVFTSSRVLHQADNSRYATPEEDDALVPRHPFPIYPFRDIEDTSLWFGQGSVDDLVEPQLALNGLESKKLLLLKKIAHAQRRAPKGAVSNWDTDGFDTVIEYSRHLGPDSIGYIQPPQWPSELSREARDKIDQMNEISGVSSALQGMANADDSGVKTRTQIGVSMGRHAPVKARWDEMWAEAHVHALQLQRRHMDVETLVLVVGENDRVSVEVFEGASLATSVDVRPVNNPISNDPVQRALMFKSFLEMTQNIEPTERARIADSLHLGSEAFLRRELNSDREKAQNENIKLSRGEQPVTEAWENDVQHLAVHYAEMNSEEWISATTQRESDSPADTERKSAIRQAYEQHVGAHEQQMAAKSAAAAGAQQQAAGQAGAAQPTGVDAPPSPVEGGSVGAPQPSIAA